MTNVNVMQGRGYFLVHYQREWTTYSKICPWVYERTKLHINFLKVNSDVIKLYETCQVKLKMAGTM